MATTTGPYALKTGGTVTVDYPSTGSFAVVLLDNVSPYRLKVSLAASTFWLPPYTSQVYKLSQQHTPPVVTAKRPTGTNVATGGTATLLATWFAPGEPLPGGIYPMAITGPAIEAGIATQGIAGVNLKTVSNGNSTGTATGGTHRMLPTTATKVYRVWAWGYSVNAIANLPTSALLRLECTGTVDAMTIPYEAASTRPAGVKANEVIIQWFGATIGHLVLWVMYSEEAK